MSNTPRKAARPRRATKTTKTTKTAKRSEPTASVVPYDGGGGLAQYRSRALAAPGLQTEPIELIELVEPNEQSEHAENTEHEAVIRSEHDEPACIEEYEYLMHEALEACEATPHEELDDAEFDIEEDCRIEAITRTSSVASSPEPQVSHASRLCRRNRTAFSETAMYTGPELWYDDADYTDEHEMYESD
jgi:hypothetical protein